MFSPFAFITTNGALAPAVNTSAQTMCRVLTDPRNAAKQGARLPQATPEREVLTVHKDNFVDQWLALKKAYVKVRGSTVGRNRKQIPKTTNADVLAITRYWMVAATMYGKRKRKRDRGAWNRWKAAIDVVMKRTKGKSPDAEYVANEQFWQRDTRRVSLWLNSFGAVPSKAELAWESVKEAVVDTPKAVAGVVTDGAVAVGDGALWVGEGVGKVVAAPLAGAASKLGVGMGTLLLGAGAIVAGIIIVPRLLKK